MLKELQGLVVKINEENENPNTLDATDMTYLEQIKGTGDILNYTEDGSGGMTALAADAAKALGMPSGWITRWIDEPYYGVTKQTQETKESSRDFSPSGLGIGGLGRYIEPVTIPTVAAIQKMERIEREMETCRRCGENDLVDGAMFTTMAGSGYCDDCC